MSGVPLSRIKANAHLNSCFLLERMDAYLTERLRRAASIARQTASSDELSSAALRDRPAAVSISNLILPRRVTPP